MLVCSSILLNFIFNVGVRYKHVLKRHIQTGLVIISVGYFRFGRGSDPSYDTVLFLYKPKINKYFLFMKSIHCQCDALVFKNALNTYCPPPHPPHIHNTYLLTWRISEIFLCKSKGRKRAAHRNVWRLTPASSIMAPWKSKLAKRYSGNMQKNIIQ